MPTAQKSAQKSKRKGRSGSVKSSRTKKRDSAVPAIEEPDAVVEARVGGEGTSRGDDGPPTADASLPGSVISVKDANESEKADNQENGAQESELHVVSTRPQSGRPTSPPAPQTSRPPSASRPNPPQAGSAAATGSKTPSRPSSAASQRPGSATVHPQADTQPQQPQQRTVPDFTAGSLRPPSAGSRVFAPPEQEPQKSDSRKPKPGTVTPAGPGMSQMGSAVSLQSRNSREVWVNGSEEKSEAAPRPTSAAPISRPMSPAASVVSVEPANSNARLDDSGQSRRPPLEIVPPDMNEAHAYVPYVYARDCIGKMMEDMRRMKRKHITIVQDIEENYQNIEKETQSQFNTFVVTLRQQYGVKVKTFRQVIEVHRAELNSKSNYWDESLTSLSNKNKQLLNDKKALLIQNKVEAERLSSEKDEALQSTLSASANKDAELDNLRKKNKWLQEELESEKDEVERPRLRLRQEVEEPRKPPKTAPSEKAVVGGEEGALVVVADLSQEDRARLDEQRRQMDQERQELKRERAKLKQEHEEFTVERTRFTEQTVVLQSSVSAAKGEGEVWRVKHDLLRAQLGDCDDWRKRYEVLLAQYEAVTLVAEVNTEEEKQKTQDKIGACTADQAMMEEEKQRLEKDVKQWENSFRKQYRRAPTEADRTESARESYTSLDEASHMLDKLRAQVSALESLRRGELPAPPVLEREVVEVRETEVKTVEVRVPDPELLAHLEMTQAEMDAMRAQLLVLKDDKSALTGERSALQGEVSDQAAQIAQLKAALQAAAEKPTAPVTATVAPAVAQKAPVSAAPVSAAPVSAAPLSSAQSDELEKLQQQLHDKDKELRLSEQSQRDAVRAVEKEKRGLEKDLKQALRALSKAEKGSSREERRLKDLLAIVAQQVREINGKVNKAAAEVDNRLTAAEGRAEQTRQLQTDAHTQYNSWEIGWTENGREPGMQDVDADKEGSGLHKALSAANKQLEADEMLVEALTLIKTGAIPEMTKAEVTQEKASPALQAAQARPVQDGGGGGGNEAEVEALEQTISELEKQVQELEDELVTARQERDLVQGEAKELEDRIAALLAEIERLKAAVADLKQREQEAVRRLQEQRILHETALRERERAHAQALEVKDEQHRAEKQEMEKDIRKLCKLIDKLKKRLQDKDDAQAAPASDLEARLRDKEREVNDLEDRLAELELNLADHETERQQMRHANKKLEEKLEVVTETLTKTETDVTELTSAASAAGVAESEARQLRSELDELKKRLKELERELRVKSKELREEQFNHERALRDKDREVKDATNDIEKLVKLIDRLRKRTKELGNEKEKLLDDIHELKEDVKDRDFELEWRKNNPEVVPPPHSERRARQSAEDYEEELTRLKTQVQVLESVQESAQTARDDVTADYQHVKKQKQELERRVALLEEELSRAEQAVAELSESAKAEQQLQRALKQIERLTASLKSAEAEIRDREREVREAEITWRAARADHEKQLRERDNMEREMTADMKKLMKQMQKLQKQSKMRTGPDLGAVSESEEEVARLERALDEAEDRLQKVQYRADDLLTENTLLQADKQRLENDKQKLESRVEQLRLELEAERERISQSVRPLSGTSPVPMLASTPEAPTAAGIDLEDYMRQVNSLQRQVDEAELRVRTEQDAHDVTRQQLHDLQQQLRELAVERENERDEAQASRDALAVKKDAELANLSKKLEDARSRLHTLEHEKHKSLPPDTQREIAQLTRRLAEKEREADGKETEKAELAASARELTAKIKSLENSSKNAKTHSSDAEVNLRALKAEKDREIKRIQGEADKKERERALHEQKKVAALEQKIRELEYAHTPGGAAKLATTKANVAKGDNKVLEERLRETKRENAELSARLKQAEKELKTGAKGAGGGASEASLKKQEKLIQELMKKLDEVNERRKKLEEAVAAREGDIKGLEKEGKKKDDEIARLKSELAQLGLAAKVAVEQETRIREMEKELKHLHAENKTLTDNFNSERVLRKKYYNMVEDMKGKIRVYTRVRPMSSDELQRGNHNVAKSPDEYTINLETGRGLKEWQFDQVFMPDSTQEKVFEDTNNLVQSAVDGYNVCIFAYGQTGSGKTFTIIGDREQRLPGIAPRAFNRIFSLLEENKSKLSYSVSCYMLELYNDKLLDLFAKPGTSSDEKLEIKKDKKGMVVVQGSEIKAVRNPKELFALFDQGTANRHTASTKMNAESSRSHLVIGIIIETTNKTTGTVMRGKLSLVDLAGSERAAKTGSAAEQLKEAMSINKSLSALGDVISALSSEQSFIPYRNNKLTMLMQDSLGGNAKTLMFVNISPADYNAEESAISLTYASRVKLITNDAQKNSDNKEISRLNNIIAKLKSGQAVDEEVDPDT